MDECRVSPFGAREFETLRYFIPRYIYVRKRVELHIDLVGYRSVYYVSGYFLRGVDQFTGVRVENGNTKLALTGFLYGGKTEGLEQFLITRKY